MSKKLKAKNSTPASTWTIVFVIFVIVVVIIIVVIIILVFVFVLVFVLFFFEDTPLRLSDLGCQFLRLVRPQQHFFLLADAVLPQGEELFVEQEHAVLAAGLNAGVDAIDLVLAYQVLNGGRHHHHLKSSHQPFAFSRQNCLGQHSDERRRQLRANLVLLLLGEHV